MLLFNWGSQQIFFFLLQSDIYCKTSDSNVSFSFSNNETILSIFRHSRRKSIIFYSRMMAITRSEELRQSPSTRDTKSASRVIRIIIRSLNNIGTILNLH
jgi:hypothetical protein